MEYNELKELSISKKIEIKEIATQLEMTANGFRESIKNETISLRKLKLLCVILKINPMLFFDTLNTGIYINGTNQIGNGNKLIIDNKDKEIEMLKQRLSDKNEIIKLLREKNSLVTEYNNITEPR